ncbi:MAG: PHB depolymerase family esterase, partial [Polyangiaceae bacterium]
ETTTGASTATAAATVASTSSGAGGGSTTSSGQGGSGAGPAKTVFGGDRAVTLHVPSDYDPASPAPLLILLHGYGATGSVQNGYWGLQSKALERGMLYAYPDGNTDPTSKQFWNATDACCDFGNSGVDDSSYLRALVEEIQGSYNVDPKRIYFTGHSNGSYMSFRMACDHADLIAGIAGLAGAMWSDPTKCPASEAVNVLHIHGDNDQTIAYAGSPNYPSAADSVAFWAQKGDCDAMPTDGAPIDIEGGISGAETTVSSYAGCKAGGAAELWTIAGGGHVPSIGANWMPSMLDWLLAHPKP